MKGPDSCFSDRSIQFLAKAARQKNPNWLDRNRAEYEDLLVNPMQELMMYVSQSLRVEAPGYRFPSRNFARIKRSKDRAVAQGWYKDWIGVSVSRDSGSMYEDFPALYFHISQKDIFSAGGLYMPSARQTKQIRCWIDQDPSKLEELFRDRKFKKHFKELGDERVLKTKPRDYPLDHPKIEWLKMMGWYVWRPISKKELFSQKFAEKLVQDWRQVLRLNQVLDHYTQFWPKTELHDTLHEIRAPQVSWDTDWGD